MSETRGKQERQELNTFIGTRCKQARISANYTQEHLSNELDVNSQFISDVERGRVGLSLLTLKQLSEILGVTTDYLIKGEKPLQSTTQLILGDRKIDLTQKEFEIMEKIINSTLEAFHINK